MGLKQDIVVVNEFTVRRPDGTGTRGATPSLYVLRYMARDDACEPIAPIQFDAENFIVRYSVRKQATEIAGSVDELKQIMREAQGKGGRAFGYGKVSLSHRDLKRASKNIQEQFDNNKTVMKIVISFDQEYLVKHKIVPEDFVCKERGDYRGHVDQLRLRHAIMRGMQRLGHNYDDLRYIGVIQVDTEHVHCHLAAVDAGVGRFAKDGTQKGKIDAPSISLLQRGIDAYLDENQHYAHLSSAVGYERVNVTTHVKKWAHTQILNETLPQLLVSCLPEDRRLWRAGSNRIEMRRANLIAREVVEEVLARPGSPMPRAMADVTAYANERRRHEGLTDERWARLIANGREQIIDQGINGIYSMLRALPADELDVRTPLLDVMSMDHETLAAQAASEPVDPLVKLGYKMRSYSSRLNHHKKERETYRARAREWEAADDAGLAAPESRVLYDFYREEEEYHAMCQAKYRKFLPFVGDDEEYWYERWDEVASYGEKMLSLEMLLNDASLRQLKDRDDAERRGIEIYGQRGARLLDTTSGRRTIQGRIDAMRRSYSEQLDDLRAEMAGAGFVMSVESLDEQRAQEITAALTARGASEHPVDVDPAHERGLAAGDTAVSQQRPVRPRDLLGTVHIEQGVEYDFETVKGLDMHHMRHDFITDIEVDEHVFAAFEQRALRRVDLLDAVQEYLERTDQKELIEVFPVQDIEAMYTAVTSMRDRGRRDQDKGIGKGLPVLESRMAELIRADRAAGHRRSATFHIGTQVVAQMNDVIDTQVARFTRHEEMQIDAALGRRGEGASQVEI